MSAFKVLNLRDFSSKIISMLFFLSLGLISFVISGGPKEGVAMPKGMPFFLLESVSALSYLFFGLLFCRIYHVKTKGKNAAVMLSLIMFFLSVLYNVTLFRFSLCVTSAFISALCIFVAVLLIRFCGKAAKNTPLFIALYILLYSYCLYFSLGMALL